MRTAQRKRLIGKQKGNNARFDTRRKSKVVQTIQGILAINIDMFGYLLLAMLLIELVRLVYIYWRNKNE